MEQERERRSGCEIMGGLGMERRERVKGRGLLRWQEGSRGEGMAEGTPKHTVKFFSNCHEDYIKAWLSVERTETE